MFTGIVEELGRIKSVQKKGAVTRLEVLAARICQDTNIGDSICVSGVCLTVVGVKDKVLAFDVIPETLGNTTLQYLRPHSQVNLERSLKTGDRIGGHFVTGHVDYIGVVRSRRISGGNLEFQISIPAKFFKKIIHKGSVVVDGISLTVAGLVRGCFSVCIIPHTVQVTTLNNTRAGSRVNIELDMLLKRP